MAAIRRGGSRSARCHESGAGDVVSLPSSDALETVRRYHEATKHHLHRFASGPGHLDWATQPDPFRRYEGAALIGLDKVPLADGPRYDEAFVEGGIHRSR